ncbi:MAG: hypothetical protein WCF67_15625, partial [Chitinophagaceae bacterium]
MKQLFPLFIYLLVISCNNASSTVEESKSTGTTSSDSKTEKSVDYKEGTDYLVYDRVRILDKKGFTEPQEAYSVLLPKGWQHDGAIEWNTPGTTCEGVFTWLKAKSGDGKNSLEIYPDVVFSWSNDSYMQQFNQQQNQGSSNCS